jgi:predicted CopG family antitoxin
MNWVTTNIRIPEDLYSELKTEAFEKKKSFGAIVREKLTKKKYSVSNNTKKLMKRLEKLARENDKQNPGISFSKKLIEMRYEQ